MNKTKRKSLFLSVALMVLSVFVIVGTTLAYFADTRNSTAPVNFGKIEISVNETFESTIALEDAMPGDKITDKISFSKSLSSEDMYVRVKAFFETDSEETIVKNFTTTLNSYSLDIVSGAGYSWDTRYQNYYYLVDSVNQTNLYNIQNGSEIIFTNEVCIPRELKQLDNFAQYMQNIDFVVEIQAIQSYNVNASISEANQMFNAIHDVATLKTTDAKHFTIVDGEITGVSTEGASMTSIVIPSTYSIDAEGNIIQGTDYEVTALGQNALADFSVLNSVYIPATVTQIDCAFTNDGLTEIVVDPNNTTFDSRDNCNAVIHTSTNTLVAGCQGTVIPDSVTSIGAYAFNGVNGLGNVVVPASVTEIGEGAFSQNDMTGVEFLGNVESLGTYAFYESKSLASVTLPNSLKSVGPYAFYYCTSLTQIDLPQGLNTLNEAAFALSGLNSIDIPNSVTTIGESVFFQCANLQNATVGTGLTGTGSMTFAYCSELTNVTLNGVVTSIDYASFFGCSKLANFTIPNTVETIGASAFQRSGVTTIVIPDRVEDIGANAFDSCTKLTDLTMGTGVVSISNGAFGLLDTFGTLRIKDLSKWLSIDFKGATANPMYYAESLYIDDILTTDITIPSDITIIKQYAFNRFVGLESVVIPANVVEIQKSAFEDCASLTSVSIANGVGSIGESAFEKCKLLSSISIPASVKDIGHSAFKSCSELISITIEEGLQNVGNYIFASCSKLTSITIPNSVVSSCDGMFQYCNALNSVTLGSGITRIGNLMFDGCKSLTSFEVPEGIQSIGQNAFRNCTALKSVVFASSVTTLDQNAFISCTVLEKITMTKNIISIGNSVFVNSSILATIYYLGTSTDWANLNASLGAGNQYFSRAKVYHITFTGEEVSVFNGDTIATDYSAQYSSSDVSVATVEATTGVVTFVDSAPVGATVTIVSTITFTNGDNVAISRTVTKA